MNTFTHTKPYIYCSLLLALTLLAGCGLSQEQIAAQTGTAQTAIAALWTPTLTNTAVPVPTATPTITSSPMPSQAPTQTFTPGPSTDPRTSFTLQDLTFSFVVPEGWKASGESDQVILNGPTTDGIQMVLTASVDQYSMLGEPMDADEVGISLFSAHVQDTIAGMISNPVNISEDFLNTPEGEPYFRWVLEHHTNGKDRHMVFYIFGSEKSFLTIMYGRATAAGNETDAVIDKTMKMLRFE